MADSHLMEATKKVNRYIWQQAICVCLDYGIKTIYHLGDVFDSRKAQTQEMLMCFQRILEELEKEGIELIVIPGNHDKTDYQSADSFLHVFKHHPGVTVVDTSLSIEVGDCTHHFVPFFDEKSGKYKEILDDVPTHFTRKDILFTHIGVNEAVMNGGSIIEDHLDGDIFKDFSKVYVGHFHDYQELQDGKIVYMGSAFQENFGEDDQKGFQLLHEDGGISFLKSDFPEFKKIVIDINTTTKEEMIALKAEHENSEDHIRFVFQGDKTKLATIDKNEFVALGIDVKTEEFDIDIVDYSEQQVATFNNETIKKEWKEFTDEDSENQKTGNQYLEKSL